MRIDDVRDNKSVNGAIPGNTVLSYPYHLLLDSSDLIGNLAELPYERFVCNGRGLINLDLRLTRLHSSLTIR